MKISTIGTAFLVIVLASFVVPDVVGMSRELNVYSMMNDTMTNMSNMANMTNMTNSTAGGSGSPGGGIAPEGDDTPTTSGGPTSEALYAVTMTAVAAFFCAV